MVAILMAPPPTQRYTTDVMAEGGTKQNCDNNNNTNIMIIPAWGGVIFFKELTMPWFSKTCYDTLKRV